MILSLTAIDPHQKWRDFFCQVNDVESALDILSGIIRQGSQPITAYLVDEGSRLELPLEAFDENTFSIPIRQLQQEWEVALTAPIAKPEVRFSNASDYFSRLVLLRQSRIGQLQQSLSQMEYLLKTTRKTMQKGPHKTRLIQRYQNTITRYQHFLAKAEASYARLVSPADALS